MLCVWVYETVEVLQFLQFDEKWKWNSRTALLNIGGSIGALQLFLVFGADPILN